MKAYCDGSGSFDTSKCVVLAGVAASEDVWAAFEKKWGEILLARDPVAPYLHMKELAHSVGAFTEENGWDDAKRQQLVTDCVLYVQHLDKKMFRTFICSIDMVKYRELEGDPALLLPTPLSICNSFVPSQIFKWFIETFNQWSEKEIYYYFDQNERFKGAFENQVRRRKKQSRVSNAWHMVKGVKNADMRDVPALQLADLVAWSHHRKLNADPDSKWASLHIFTDGLMPYTRADIDEKALNWIATVGQIGSVAMEYFK